MLDESLRRIIQVAKLEGIIPFDQIADIEIVRLDEHGEMESVILTLNPDYAVR